MKAKCHLNRAIFWLAGLAGGGTLFQLGGCNDEVKNTVFTGVQDATTSLVQAFISALFLSIAPEPEPDITTVKAVLEHVQSFFC